MAEPPAVAARRGALLDAPAQRCLDRA